MTDVRVTGFNVNQFSTRGHELADITKRMQSSDVLMLQETVNVDLVAFVQSQPGWVAFQIRHGDSDGHANTAVLHRTSLNLAGPRVTDEVLLGDTKGLRRRFLAAEKLTFAWSAAAHINPKRFSADIPTQLKHLGEWVKTHPGPVIIGLDKNQCPAADLEHATGLTWHGLGIDGFLTNLPLKALAEFHKGFSDHPGVHATVTTKDPTLPTPTPDTTHPLRAILAALRAALGVFKAKGNKRRAARTQAAIDALKPKPVVKPKPPKPQPVPTVPRGFMPGAIVENITPGANDPAIIPCGVLEHIAVSNSDDIRPIFTDGRGIESHFYVRFDGTILQYRSIFFEADANAMGNSFGTPRKGFVSVEHEGGFPNGQGVLTAAQLASFKEIVLWVKSQADFPLRVAPAWNAAGVGYHSLHPEWNPNGHTCPGPDRIKQFNAVIVPWLAAGAK